MSEYSLENRYDLIKQDIMKFTSKKNPITIALQLMKKDFINIHGAAFLTAFRNAGGDINLGQCLDELAKRAFKMPGAMCGHWGSIIDY